MTRKEKINAMLYYFDECIKNDTLYEEDLTLGFIKIAREHIMILEAENIALKDKEKVYREMIDKYFVDGAKTKK